MSIKQTIVASILTATAIGADTAIADNIPDQIPSNAPPIKMVFQSASNSVDNAFKIGHEMGTQHISSKEGKFQHCLDTAASAYQSIMGAANITNNHNYEFVAPQIYQNFLETATHRMEAYLEQCINTYDGQIISTEQAQKIEQIHTESTQSLIEKMQPLGQHESLPDQPEITAPKVTIPIAGV